MNFQQVVNLFSPKMSEFVNMFLDRGFDEKLDCICMFAPDTNWHNLKLELSGVPAEVATGMPVIVSYKKAKLLQEVDENFAADLDLSVPDGITAVIFHDGDESEPPGVAIYMITPVASTMLH